MPGPAGCRHASLCDFSEYGGARLVLEGRKGPVVVLLLPEKHIAAPKAMSGDRSEGILVPTNNGSMVIVGNKDEALPDRAAGNEKSIGRQQSVTTESPIPRKQHSSKVVLGRKLFVQNCVSCHSSRAEGGPLWSKTGPFTKNPSPPLNGTGHTWYHPTAVLKRITAPAN